MLNDTLNKIKHIFTQNKNISNETKEELLSLFSQLESELHTLSSKQEEDANSIAGFTKVAAHESLRQDQDSELKKVSQKGLQSSIRKFETSNPGLVKVINRISNVLSSIGV